MKISQITSDFVSEFNTGVDYLNTSGTATRLQVSAPRVLSLNTDKTNLNAAFDTYKNPLTHTPPVITAMQKQYGIAHPEYQGLKKQLKYNMDIVLLPADISALNIHVDAQHRAKVPAPTIAPNNQVIHQTHLVTQIFTNNPNPPHEKETFMPTDVSKISRKLAIVKPDVVPGPTDYIHVGSIGSTRYNLIFDDGDVNKIAWLITSYLSPTGESGPESKPVFFTII